MKFLSRSAPLVFGLVLVWRVLLLVFTVQPIPSSDCFGYDGGVINYLHGGRYCNPSMSLDFPISGRDVYATYPPVYQGVLFLWMKLFGAGLVSAMVLHLVLFAISGWIALAIIRQFFPASSGGGLVAWLFFGFTFVDRPESLGYVFGLGSFWLVARQLSEPAFRPGIALALLLALWLGLYTSVIVGAYFFAVGFLACVVACRWEWRQNWHWFAPFFGAAALFGLVTICIIKFEPLWWAGFLENARQQPAMSLGFHVPQFIAIVKLVRTTPVFLLALAVLPLLVVRWREVVSQPSAWLALCIGIFVTGWGLLAVSVTLLSPTYVFFAAFSQILLAAGLLALVEQYSPGRGRWLRAGLLACALLVSVRALGISTWGAASAWKNSYQSTQTILRQELQPYVATDQPVLLSSAFLYGAADLGVKNPVNCDWYFDHAHWTNNAQTAALERLCPPKLVLTQFDYYRSFKPLIGQLRQHPERVDIHVHNFANLPVPDAIPSLERVVQHISWAPVIVDLAWKQP